MPERRQFRGREVKHARRLTIDGRVIIRITFKGRKGQPGPQIDVPLEQYDAEVQRSFVARSN